MFCDNCNFLIKYHYLIHLINCPFVNNFDCDSKKNIKKRKREDKEQKI